MQEALFFFVRTVLELYVLTYILRLILQAVRADLYNPLSQFVLQITNPVVLRLRRFVPSVAGIDTATVLALVVLQSLTSALLLALAGQSLPPPAFVLFVAVSLLRITLWTYLILIIVHAVLSWTGQSYTSPISGVLRQAVEPLLRPVRRVLPPIGGLDLSPLIVLIAIQALMIAIR